MVTVALQFYSQTAWSGSCGTTGTYDWDAYGCAINDIRSKTLYLRDQYAVIPTGSTIDQVDWSFDAYTDGPAAAVAGELAVTLVGYDTVGFFTMNKTDTSYPRVVYPGSIWAGGDVNFDIAVRNKEDFYQSHHYCVLGTVLVSYTPPRNNNLFFGSTF